MPKENQFYQINFRVDKKTYALFHALSEKQKQNIKKLLKILIATAYTNEELSTILEFSSSIEFTEETKKFLRELIRGEEEEKIKKYEKCCNVLRSAYNVYISNNRDPCIAFKFILYNYNHLLDR